MRKGSEDSQIMSHAQLILAILVILMVIIFIVSFLVSKGIIDKFW